MKFFIEVLKVTGQFLWWTIVNALWKPVKFVTVGLFTAYKASKKPKFETKNAMSDVQKEAAKNLPELTKKLESLNDEMKKLSDKWNVANTEKKAVEALIKAAGGDFGQNSKPQRGGGNNNNNNQQKQKGGNNNNNGNQSTPVIGDADFTS